MGPVRRRTLLALSIGVVAAVAAAATITALTGEPALQFTGSYNATYPVASSAARCTIINENLRYRVHAQGGSLNFWVDIPYRGPWQSSYSGTFNNAGMEVGDYAGLVRTKGTVTITSETSQRATGTLDLQGYLYYEHPGPLRVTGAWACSID